MVGSHNDTLTHHSIGLEQSIRDDVALLKEWPFLPDGATVAGYAFDIQLGTLEQIV